MFVNLLLFKGFNFSIESHDNTQVIHYTVVITIRLTVTKYPYPKKTM